MTMHYLYIFVISMVPLIEQRGSIPVGVLAYGLNPAVVFLVCLLGSFIPAPLVYLFFNKILAKIEPPTKTTPLNKIQK